MKKRIIVLFILFAVLSLNFQIIVSADSEFEYKVSGDIVGIAEYKGHSEKVEIPSETDDGKVTVILSGAFKGNKDIKSVVIPESIVKIAEKAFEDCTSLKDVYYSGTAENWDKVSVAESGNDSFAKAELHFQNTSEKVFENEFFRYRVNDGDEITIIKCKSNYDENTKIVFPAFIGDRKVIGIEDGAFENSRNISEIKLDEGIKYIGAKAFMNCQELKKIKLPDSLERIGSNAFTNTKMYNESPDGSIYIDGWYCGYKGDTSKELDIRIQRNAKGIAEFAFYKNEDVENVFFTKGIRYIGSGAFGECRSLSGIFFEGTKKDWSEIKIGSGNESLSESKIRYNMTIDDYSVNVYKGLCTTLLIIIGILVAVLAYCISKITVQKQTISQLMKRKKAKQSDGKKRISPKIPPVKPKVRSVSKKNGLEEKSEQ